MGLSEIKAVLKATLGAHVDAVGDSSVERAVRQRMGALEISSDVDYLRLLQSDRDELAELIDEIVVPETWFFRNIMPFNTLAHMLPTLLRANPARDLRILSLPCASGEEPYSIVMALLERRAEMECSFTVDAVDVSSRALRRAREACYGEHSFREGDAVQAIRHKYFTREECGNRLTSAVTRHVNFVQANVLTDAFAPGAACYDVIFCRNLLIYFDRETQITVLGKLEFLLKPHGLLFLGHAEATPQLNDRFVRVDTPMAFAFQKKAPKGAVAVAPTLSVVAPLHTPVIRNADAMSRETRVRVPPSQESPLVPAPALRDRLAAAVELGRLDEVISECERLISAEPGNAEAYYYLGLISQMQGSNGVAESFLRKATYLDPDHHLALNLAATLAEQRGDDRHAQALRQRGQRALQRNSATGNVR